MNHSTANKPGVMIYFEILPIIEQLSNASQLALFWAIMNYARTGKEPKLRREASIIWSFIQPMLDRDQERYARTLEARRKGGLAKAAKMREQQRLLQQNEQDA